MATINQKTFPGVYTNIIDQSLTATTTSQFTPGLVGVASNGPLDTPTQVSTIQDFIRIFGQPIPGYFLGTALGVIAPYTNGAMVVRVANKYQSLPQSGANYAVLSVTGTSFESAAAPLLDPSTGITTTGNTYISVTQPGKLSSYNLPVASTSGINVILNGTMRDTYTAGAVEASFWLDAASDAQAILLNYVYQDITTDLGTVSGTKGNYYFTTTSISSRLKVGSLIRLSQSACYPSPELLVAGITPLVGGASVVQLQQTNDTARGYQALPLQDNYTAASVQVVSSTGKGAIIQAVNPGQWANTQAGTPVTGMQVQVSPGSKPGTKQIAIYLNGAEVELYDNLGSNPTLSTTGTLAGVVDYANTINVASPSNYITIYMLGTELANTINGWNATPSSPILALGSGTNQSNLAVPVNDAATALGNGGYFVDGYNGENAQASDYVGVYNPVTDVSTGIKTFEDTDNITITHLCAPGVTDGTVGASLPVHAQIRDTAKVANAVGYIDVPKNTNDTFPISTVANPLATNIWSAIDWCNGQGQFKSRGLLNTPYLAAFWNWITLDDPITQQSVAAPPTIGALEATAFTWLNYQPWYSAAGEKHGVVSEATAVQFPKISEDAKQAMYGNGNVVNPIISRGGVIMVFGEQTMLRIPQGTTDKLTAVHNLVLVEYVVDGLANIGRTFVFDPNDATLLTQLNLAMTQFLNGIVNLRGIEAYNLVCDTSNNTAATRNLREVIVDLYIVPTDSVEKIYINAMVMASGAVLNSVTS